MTLGSGGFSSGGFCLGGGFCPGDGFCLDGGFLFKRQSVERFGLGLI